MPFEKEININLVYSSCLKHANEMLLSDPRQADQRTQNAKLPLPHRRSSITRPCCSIERSSAKLLVFTVMHFEHSTGSESESTRRRGNHMHDHSRFQRDIDDVTGVSLSLSLSLLLLLLLLTKVTDAQWRKRFRTSYNIPQYRLFSHKQSSMATIAKDAKCNWMATLDRELCPLHFRWTNVTFE